MEKVKHEKALLKNWKRLAAKYFLKMNGKTFLSYFYRSNLFS